MFVECNKCSQGHGLIKKRNAHRVACFTFHKAHRHFLFLFSSWYPTSTHWVSREFFSKKLSQVFMPCEALVVGFRVLVLWEFPVGAKFWCWRSLHLGDPRKRKASDTHNTKAFWEWAKNFGFWEGSHQWMRPGGGVLSMGPCQKNTFLHLSLVIYIFCNPTQKTKIGTANRWETSNSNPLRPIISIVDWKIGNSSQIIFITLFSSLASTLVPDSANSTAKILGQNHFTHSAKLAYFDFCSSNLMCGVTHTLSTAGDVL